MSERSTPLLRFRSRRLLVALVAILSLCNGVSQAGPPADPAAEWLPEPTVERLPDEIRDPFFEFIVGIIEGDSLGVWTRADVEARVALTGRESRLPLERLTTLERSHDPDDPELRRLRLELDAPLDLSVPWSILGYHPGSLHAAMAIEVIERRLPDGMLHLRDGAGRRWASSIRVMMIETGHLILDADALVDRLLGAKLDDAWFTGFVLARVEPREDEDELQGLAMGLSRKLRLLVGGIDFRRDKILPNGEPVPTALLTYVKRMVDMPTDRAWSWEP